jgi:hypothetical protein
MSLEEPDRLAYQYLLVELQSTRATTLVLSASWPSPSSSSDPIRTLPYPALIAGLLDAAVALSVWRYSDDLGVIKSAAKRYAFQSSEVNLVEIIRNEVVPKEVRMAG